MQLKIDTAERCKKFKEPLRFHEIDWKIGSYVYTDKTKAVVKYSIIMPYIDNRAVMNRLDDCFTPVGWRDEYILWRDKGVKCTIYILHDGQWIGKNDGADETEIEPTKGGFSDSMKRAATKWGLGRELYDFPTILYKGELRRIDDKVKPKLSVIYNAIGTPSQKSLYVIEAGKEFASKDTIPTNHPDGKLKYTGSDYKDAPTLRELPGKMWIGQEKAWYFNDTPENIEAIKKLGKGRLVNKAGEVLN